MRWLLLVLVFMNIGYGLYAWLVPSNEVPQMVTLDRGDNSVPLLIKLDEIEESIGTNQPIPTTQSQVLEERKAMLQTTKKQCFSMGPFKSNEEIAPVMSWLTAKQSAVGSIRQAEDRKLQGYWVFLPPYQDRDEALKISAKLDAEGIKDYFIVTEDENKNAISLGYYNVKSGADARYEDFLKRGYKPKMNTRYREIPAFWIDLDRQISMSDYSDTFKDKIKTEISVISGKCKS